MERHAGSIYTFGRFHLDCAERRLLRDGEAVSLTPKAFDTLLALVQNSGHVLTKDELMRTVWPDGFVEEVNLAYNISILRKALADGRPGKTYIETVPKLGYRFVASVHEEPKALQAEAAEWRSNLPSPLTGFIGREREMAEIRRLLDRHRLLTLVGPPGVGKTRLALQVASQARHNFADGACFVPLAHLTNPGLVATTIAQALMLSTAQADPLARLKLYLRGKHLLLVLDNFEHLLSEVERSNAALIVADILTVAPDVKALTTSRAALRLSGEFLVDVQPLDATAAVELFVARAAAVRRGFVMTAENQAVVGEICRRLDGLPLAIELAATRLRLFSPKALLTQLNSAALDVLSEGPHDLPTRQRTLRNTIAWSYQLLTSGQQRLLCSLSVFAGGCAREAAQVVAGHPPLFDSDLQALMDSSLVQRSDDPNGEMRFSLLEMIREYAVEQLAACGEVEAVRHKHAAYYLECVKSKAPRVFQQTGSPMRSEDGVIGKGEWLTQLEREHDNFRIALTWSLGNGKEDGRDVNIGAELALWLYWLWLTFGPWSEATYWLERALAQLQPSAPLQIRAGLLTQLACFLAVVGDPVQAERAAQEALRIHAALEDPHTMAMTFGVLADVQMERNRLKEAQLSSEKHLAIGREIDDRWYVAVALLYLAEIALCQKDFARAAELCAEGLRIDLGNEVAINHRGMLGTLACYQRDFDRAETLGQEMLAIFQKARWSHGVATVLHSLGDVALFRGDLARAKSRFAESLRLFSENGNKQRAAWCLSGLAAVAATEGQASQAVTLWSAAEAVRASIGHLRPALRSDDYRERVDAVRGQLDERALSVAIAAGKAMNFDQAVEYADALALADALKVG